jgi:hypothetical protein
MKRWFSYASAIALATAASPGVFAGCGGSLVAGEDTPDGSSDSSDGACAQLCCEPPAAGRGSPSFQCEAAGVACTLPNAACMTGDSGADASCDHVCCNPPPGGRGSPSFQCVGPGASCVLPSSACMTDAAAPPDAPTCHGSCPQPNGASCTSDCDCFNKCIAGACADAPHPAVHCTGGTGTCPPGQTCNASLGACEGTSCTSNDDCPPQEQCTAAHCQFYGCL